MHIFPLTYVEFLSPLGPRRSHRICWSCWSQRCRCEYHKSQKPNVHLCLKPIPAKTRPWGVCVVGPCWNPWREGSCRRQGRERHEGTAWTSWSPGNARTICKSWCITVHRNICNNVEKAATHASARMHQSCNQKCFMK